MHLPDDADDGAPVLIVGRADAAAEWIAAGKESRREHLVNHRHQRCAGHVPLGEQAACAERNSHRLEVAGRRPAQVRAIGTIGRRWLAVNHQAKSQQYVTSKAT